MALNDSELGKQLRTLAVRLTAIARAAGRPYDVERKCDEVIVIFRAHFRSMRPEANAVASEGAIRDILSDALWAAATYADIDVQATTDCAADRWVQTQQDPNPQ